MSHPSNNTLSINPNINWNLVIYIKVISHVPIRYVTLKSSLASSWEVDEDFKLEKRGDGIYRIEFESLDDRIIACSASPIVIKNKFVTVCKWIQSLPVEELGLHLVPMWITISGFPDEYNTIPNAKMVAKQVGDILDFEEMSFQMRGETIYCFFCAHLGHVYVECPKYKEYGLGWEFGVVENLKTTFRYPPRLMKFLSPSEMHKIRKNKTTLLSNKINYLQNIYQAKLAQNQQLLNSDSIQSENTAFVEENPILNSNISNPNLFSHPTEPTLHHSNNLQIMSAFTPHNSVPNPTFDTYLKAGGENMEKPNFVFGSSSFGQTEMLETNQFHKQDPNLGKYLDLPESVNWCFNAMKYGPSIHDWITQQANLTNCSEAFNPFKQIKQERISPSFSSSQEPIEEPYNRKRKGYSDRITLDDEVEEWYTASPARRRRTLEPGFESGLKSSTSEKVASSEKEYDKKQNGKEKIYEADWNKNSSLEHSDESSDCSFRKSGNLYPSCNQIHEKDCRLNIESYSDLGVPTTFNFCKFAPTKSL